ncbi:hypothetical protein L0Y65_01280 [Candidatus Micrarchaeota archaeon]|nr:hypothetical protein [Candidatus Micrarchaeota archaeon]
MANNSRFGRNFNNGTISRGQFLRTAGVGAGAVAAAGLGLSGVARADWPDTSGNVIQNGAGGFIVYPTEVQADDYFNVKNAVMDAAPGASILLKATKKDNVTPAAFNFGTMRIDIIARSVVIRGEAFGASVTTINSSANEVFRVTGCSGGSVHFNDPLPEDLTLEQYQAMYPKLLRINHLTPSTTAITIRSFSNIGTSVGVHSCEINSTRCAIQRNAMVGTNGDSLKVINVKIATGKTPADMPGFPAPPTFPANFVPSNPHGITLSPTGLNASTQGRFPMRDFSVIGCDMALPGRPYSPSLPTISTNGIHCTGTQVASMTTWYFGGWNGPDTTVKVQNNRIQNSSPGILMANVNSGNSVDVSGNDISCVGLFISGSMAFGGGIFLTSGHSKDVNPQPGPASTIVSKNTVYLDLTKVPTPVGGNTALALGNGGMVPIAVGNDITGYFYNNATVSGNTIRMAPGAWVDYGIRLYGTNNQFHANDLTGMTAQKAQLWMQPFRFMNADYESTANTFTNDAYGPVVLSPTPGLAGALVDGIGNALTNENFFGQYPGVYGSPQVPCILLPVGATGNMITALKNNQSLQGFDLCFQLLDMNPAGANTVPGASKCGAVPAGVLDGFKARYCEANGGIWSGGVCTVSAMADVAVEVSEEPPE